MQTQGSTEPEGRLGASQRSESDFYGTFEADLRAQVAPFESQSRRSKSTALLRAAGVATFLLVAAMGYSMVSTTDPSVMLSETLETSVTALQSVEESFVHGVSAENLREFQHQFSSVPHVAGSPQDYESAVYAAKQFESYGLHAEIKTYYTLLSTPVRLHLAITEPANAARELNLTEPAVLGDACTSDEDALPPFLAYAATGNVTASIVYVNYGRPEDFEWLVANNVTLKGKIALARYGLNYRGLKVMVAEEHGMIGALIYSDPKDDGFVQGPVYPDGPWRPEDSFQRGATIFLSLAAGDPLTPGWASVPGAPYLKYEDAKTIPHIPALPLSYGQAKHILGSLGGKQAPSEWQGGLSFPNGYHVGDDKVTVVNMDIEMDNKVTPIWDVIGTIEGSEEPDQQVLLGNHRDAWVCGAVDPSSGTAVLLEIARGLGELLKTGWKPRRTLVLGSWDGEEPGLLGSTEYAEDNAEVLKKQAVAYLNVDSTIGSLVSASASPSIAEFLFQTAKAIPANKFFGNEKEKTLYEQWVKQSELRRAKLDGADDGTLGPDHLVNLLGSGSDYSAFYQHLGIISVDLGFSLSDAPYGVYHSSMDSLMYSELYADPGYTTHVTTTQWWGLLGLRLADDEVLPFDYTTYAFVMTEDLVKLEAQVTGVDFSELHEAIARFSKTAITFHTELDAFVADTTTASETTGLDEWNEKLVMLERHLISEEGLPHRPWYKHVIFGPGFYEGYKGAAFPGISDAIAFKDDAATIQAHVDEVASIVNDAAEFLA